MCKVDVTAQTLVIPSVIELSARLELGALKLAVFQFAVPEILGTRGGLPSPSLAVVISHLLMIRLCAAHWRLAS